MTTTLSMVAWPRRGFLRESAGGRKRDNAEQVTRVTSPVLRDEELVVRDAFGRRRTGQRCP